MKTVVACLSVALIACSDVPPAQTLPDSAELPVPGAPGLPALDSGAPSLRPVDQADASFRAFREQTLAALARRDTAYLYDILAPDIRNSFGGDDSIAGFKRIWNMHAPDTEVWASLTRVLQMGGKLDANTFVAPYVFAFWPDSLDAFEHIAVTTSGALLRATPDRTAPPIGTATFSILRTGPTQRGGWRRVQLPAGDSAWIEAAHTYSPVGWRAFFVRRDDQWRMNLFVAGD